MADDSAAASSGLAVECTVHVWVPNAIGKRRDAQEEEATNAALLRGDAADTPTADSTASGGGAQDASGAQPSNPPTAEILGVSVPLPSVVPGVSNDKRAPPKATSVPLLVKPYPQNGRSGSWRPRHLVVSGATRRVAIRKFLGEERFDVDIKDILALDRHYVRSDDAVKLDGYDRASGKRLTARQQQQIAQGSGGDNLVAPTALSGGVGMRIDAGKDRKLRLLFDTTDDLDRVHHALQQVLTAVLHYDLFSDGPESTTTTVTNQPIPSTPPAAPTAAPVVGALPEAHDFVGAFLEGKTKEEEKARKLDQQAKAITATALSKITGTPTATLDVPDPRTGKSTTWLVRRSSKKPNVLKLTQQHDSVIKNIARSGGLQNAIDCERLIVKRLSPWKPHLVLVVVPPDVKVAGRPQPRRQQLTIDVGSFEARTKWEAWFVERGAVLKIAADQDPSGDAASAQGSPRGGSQPGQPGDDLDHLAHSTIGRSMLQSFAISSPTARDSNAGSPVDGANNASFGAASRDPHNTSDFFNAAADVDDFTQDASFLLSSPRSAAGFASPAPRGLDQDDEQSLNRLLRSPSSSSVAAQRPFASPASPKAPPTAAGTPSIAATVSHTDPMKRWTFTRADSPNGAAVPDGQVASPAKFAVSFARDDEAPSLVEPLSPARQATPRRWEAARSALKAAQRIASPTRQADRASSPVLSRRVAAETGAEKRARGFRLSDPVFNDPAPTDGSDTAKQQQQKKAASRVTLLPMHKEDAGGIAHMLDADEADATAARHGTSGNSSKRYGGTDAAASSLGLRGDLARQGISHEITAFETAATAACPHHASQSGGGGSQPLPRYNPAAWRLSREVEDAPTSSHAAAHFTFGFAGVFQRPPGDHERDVAVGLPSSQAAPLGGQAQPAVAKKPNMSRPPQQSGVYCHGAISAHEFYLPAEGETAGDAQSELGTPPPVYLATPTPTPPAAPADPPCQLPSNAVGLESGAQQPLFCLAQGYLPERDALVVATDARRSFDDSMARLAQERSGQANGALNLDSSRLLLPASSALQQTDDAGGDEDHHREGCPSWPRHPGSSSSPSSHVAAPAPRTASATFDRVPTKAVPHTAAPAPSTGDATDQAPQADETCALCGLAKLSNPTCAKSGRPHRLGVQRRFGAPTLTPLQRDQANRAASSSSSSSLLRSGGR